VIPPKVGAFPKEWEDKTRLGCADSEEGGKSKGLEAGGRVGEELGITSSWLEGSLGRSKDASRLAESASGCIASGGGVIEGCESDTRYVPRGGSAPVFAIYESQRMSITGVPHTRALSYFAPAADGHNKWVVARLNVGA
jgi:hypothetical protein